MVIFARCVCCACDDLPCTQIYSLPFHHHLSFLVRDICTVALTICFGGGSRHTKRNHRSVMDSTCDQYVDVSRPYRGRFFGI